MESTASPTGQSCKTETDAAALRRELLTLVSESPGSKGTGASKLSLVAGACNCLDLLLSARSDPGPTTGVVCT